MTENIIQSTWGLIYYRDEDGPRFLLIKRRALSHKIERVAPKGKIQKWEKIEDAVLREISEEAGIPINQLKLRQKIWKTELRNTEKIRWYMNKDVTYFLVEYKWDPEDVHVELVEGYTWVYKWANIQDILNLVYYSNLRELFRVSYKFLQEQGRKNAIKEDFLNKI